MKKTTVTKKEIKRFLDNWASMDVTKTLRDHKGRAVGTISENYAEVNKVCSWGADRTVFMDISNKDDTIHFTLEVSLKTAKRMLADLKDLIDCVEEK